MPQSCHFLQCTVSLAAGVIEVGIAASILAASAVYLKLKNIKKFGNVAFTCITCAIIIGLGFVIEPIILEILGSSSMAVGSIYFIEFYTFESISNAVITILVRGSIPGVIIGIIIMQTNSGKKITTIMLYSAVILMAIDVLSYAKPLINYWSGANDTDFGRLGLSLLNDAVGGPIAGILCFIIASQQDANSNHDYRNTVKKPMVVLAYTILTSIIGYILLIHPIASEFSMNLSRTKNMIISYYKGNEDIKQGGNKKLDILFGAYPAFIKSNDIDVSRYGSVISPLKLSTKDSDGVITALAFAASGCKSQDEVLSLANDNQNSVNISNSYITIDGDRQRLLVASEENKNSVIRIGYNTHVHANTDGDAKPYLYFNGESEIVVPVIAGMMFVITSSPRTMEFVEKNKKVPSGPDDINRSKMSITNERGNTEIALPKAERSSCTIFGMNDTVPSESGGDVNFISTDYFIIKITESKGDAKLRVDIENSFIHIGNDNNPIFNGKRQSLSLFEALVTDGEISIGLDRTKLSNNDSVIISGDDITYTPGKDGSNSVIGKSKYILINGRLLNKTLWMSLEVELRVALATSIFAMIGWIVRRKLRWILKIAIE